MSRRGWGPLSYSWVTSNTKKTVSKSNNQLSSRGQGRIWWASNETIMVSHLRSRMVTEPHMDKEKIWNRSVCGWLSSYRLSNPTEPPYTYAIILFYNGTSAKLSMVSRRGCWPNTTCYLTASLSGMRSHFSLVVNQSCPDLIARPWVLFSIWIK